MTGAGCWELHKSRILLVGSRNCSSDRSIDATAPPPRLLDGLQTEGIILTELVVIRYKGVATGGAPAGALQLAAAAAAITAAADAVHLAGPVWTQRAGVRAAGSGPVAVAAVSRLQRLRIVVPSTYRSKRVCADSPVFQRSTVPHILRCALPFAMCCPCATRTRLVRRMP